MAPAIGDESCYALAVVVHVGSFLIVEPDGPTAEVVAKLCRKLRRARVAPTAVAAREVLEKRPRLTGMIVEEELPDDRGTNLLKEVRYQQPLLPVLVLTANTDPVVINRANRYRAEFLAKPTRRSALSGFLARAVAFERVPQHRVSFLIQEAVDSCGLSPRETDVLAAAVAGVTRKEMADQLGTSQNTIKSVVKSALRKLPHDTLDDAAREILHNALDGSSARTLAELYRNRETPPPHAPLTIRPPGEVSD